MSSTTQQQTQQQSQQTQQSQSSGVSGLSDTFRQQANISGRGGVPTYYDPNPLPIAGYNFGRNSNHHFNRESVFDTHSAYQNHHNSIQQRRQQQQQQTGQSGQGQQQEIGQVPEGASQQFLGGQQQQRQEATYSEEDYKKAKEEEKAELVKYEEVRKHVNELIGGQDWANMSVKHIHEFGDKLRDAEKKFWNLKPAAEKLVVKGRPRLAERIDAAEEELLHAILVVSHIYRERIEGIAQPSRGGKRYVYSTQGGQGQTSGYYGGNYNHYSGAGFQGAPQYVGGGHRHHRSHRSRDGAFGGNGQEYGYY